MLHYMRMRIHLVSRHARNERGATAVEYGLLVVLIAAVIVATVAAIGGKIGAGFDTVNTNLGSETGGTE
jgi:pilus assembly protein Flp/PilA